jgi:hypothetical protein
VNIGDVAQHTGQRYLHANDDELDLLISVLCRKPPNTSQQALTLLGCHNCCLMLLGLDMLPAKFAKLNVNSSASESSMHGCQSDTTLF